MMGAVLRWKSVLITIPFTGIYGRCVCEAGLARQGAMVPCGGPRVPVRGYPLNSRSSCDSGRSVARDTGLWSGVRQSVTSAWGRGQSVDSDVSLSVRFDARLSVCFNATAVAHHRNVASIGLYREEGRYPCPSDAIKAHISVPTGAPAVKSLLRHEDLYYRGEFYKSIIMSA